MFKLIKNQYMKINAIKYPFKTVHWKIRNYIRQMLIGYRAKKIPHSMSYTDGAVSGLFNLGYESKNIYPLWLTNPTPGHKFQRNSYWALKEVVLFAII